MPDYLDTSAFIKLVRSEPESPTLRREIAGAQLISSALLAVEGRRAAKRYGGLASSRASAALATITLLPLDEEIIGAAGELEPPELRSLDALHLATILSLGREIERVYCYDARLCNAAVAHGVRISAPS